MIRHIVIWKFKEEAGGLSKSENLQKGKQMLMDLKEQISQILSIEVVINSPKAKAGNFDMLLDTTFESWEALNEYAAHPEHQKVVEFIKIVVEDRACVDAEI